MKIIEVTPSLRSYYKDELRDFAHNFQYPFGQDSFVIDHGQNYFTFFDRLGKPYIYIGEEDNKIIAMIIIVLRDIDLYGQGIKQKIWYICDLKIHPNFRGNYFVQKVVEIVSAKYRYLSSKVYGVSMNSLKGPNRLISFANRINNLGLELSGELNFYLLTFSQLIKVKNLLIKDYITFNFISLLRKKDLILNSTKKPLPILHFSPNATFEDKFNNLNNNFLYMFCFSLDNPINTEFKRLKLPQVASASIISNIKNCNWKFILTSDI